MSTKTKRINKPKSDVVIPEPEKTTTRIIPVRVVQVPGKDRVLRFIASTEEVARDGDIILVKGWQFDEFERNPVFLWAHSSSELPIGRVIKLKKVLKPEPRLEIDVEFAGLDQLHDKAETIYLLYRDGFLHAVSVRWKTLEYQDLADAQKAELGLDGWGRVIKKASLWEVSAVPVPADTGAVIIDEDDRAAVREQLACVRAMASPEEQERFDALDASLDAEPEPEPPTEPEPDPEPLVGLDALATEIRALREVVEQRLPQASAPEPSTLPDPADEPADDADTRADPPPPPAQDEPPEEDPYRIIEATLDRTSAQRKPTP